MAWLVRIQLFHLSFRFRFPLALFPRSFSPSPSALGVNFLLLSKGMGTGRGSDAPPGRCGGTGPLQTALNTAEGSQETSSALCSRILLLFQDWGIIIDPSYFSFLLSSLTDLNTHSVGINLKLPTLITIFVFLPPFIIFLQAYYK